jgi:hypothetical protein
MRAQGSSTRARVQVRPYAMQILQAMRMMQAVQAAQVAMTTT